MLHKKNIIALFSFLLFSFFIAKGFAPDNRKKQRNTTEISSGNSTNITNGNDCENTISVEGILHTPININYSYNSAFQKLKNNKKSFFLKPQLLSFEYTKSSYSFYCAKIINSSATYPLYIANRNILI